MSFFTRCQNCNGMQPQPDNGTCFCRHCHHRYDVSAEKCDCLLCSGRFAMFAPGSIAIPDVTVPEIPLPELPDKRELMAEERRCPQRETEIRFQSREPGEWWVSVRVFDNEVELRFSALKDAEDSFSITIGSEALGRWVHIIGGMG